MVLPHFDNPGALSAVNIAANNRAQKLKELQKKAENYSKKLRQSRNTTGSSGGGSTTTVTPVSPTHSVNTPRTTSRTDFKGPKHYWSTLNPPFSINHIGYAVGDSHVLTQVTKGYLKVVKDSTQHTTPVYGTIGFMFNPSSITVDHPQNSQVVQENAKQLNNPVSGRETLVAPFGSLSVQLYFDRQLDVQPAPNKPRVPNGVWADILALYDVLGITRVVSSSDTVIQTRAVKPGNKTNKPTPTTIPLKGTTFAVQPMGWTEAWLNLGDLTQYYGVINDLQYTIQKWTPEMVPTQVTVTLSMTLRTPPNLAKNKALMARNVGTQTFKAVTKASPGKAAQGAKVTNKTVNSKMNVKPQISGSTGTHTGGDIG